MAEVDATIPGQSRRLMLGGGAIAGVIGGIVVSLFALIASAARGVKNPWTGAKAAAYPFLRARAIAPGFDAGAVVLGIAAQFVVSITWGILFALLAFGLSRWATVWTSLLFGIVVWVVMFYVVLPAVGAYALVRGMPVGPAILEHVIFGLAVGLGFLPFQRRRPERPRRWHLRPV